MIRRLVCWTLACIVLSACARVNPTMDINEIGTAVAQTLEAEPLDYERPPATLTMTSTPIPTMTPAPLLIESPTSTLLATQKPIAASLTVNTPVKCRYGPGTVYNVLRYLSPGDTAEIAGRHVFGEWWLIRRPDDPNKVCWVWEGAIDLNGDVSVLPIATPPPPPTPTFTPEPTLTPPSPECPPVCP